jgi:hypothetical protein
MLPDMLGCYILKMAVATMYYISAIATPQNLLRLSNKLKKD